MAGHQRWEVVGGVDKGGILVRVGEGLVSEQLDKRLATGAIVEELALAGDRLQFKRISGDGPDEGWVSIKIGGKVLLAKASAAPEMVNKASSAPDLHRNALPVLVCFYSGGMTAAQGTGHLSDFAKAARQAGLTDQLVLDHATEDDYKDCQDWDAYVRALARKVDQDFSGRQLLVFAHSHGCLAAYGLAKQLGPTRVLKLYVVARRPPTQPLLDEVWGVASGRNVQALGDEQLLSGLLGAWNNAYLADAFQYKPLPPAVGKILACVRAQYSTPCAPGGSADLQAVLGNSPEAAKLPVPILAVACGKELAKGETAAKMEGWRQLTLASFELLTVESADHMDCLMASALGNNSELVELVMKDMQQFIPQVRV